MNYPGAKAGAGVYQTIINAMPPHRLYVEAFVGSGAILLRKKPAEASIVIDADADVAAHWSTIAARGEPAGGALLVRHGDARSIIAELRDTGRLGPGALVYCDPPYVRSTRRNPDPLYKHEMTNGAHRSLVSLLLTLQCAVMVSGYAHPIYQRQLGQWRRIDYQAMTRAGPAVESLWLNFDPAELHDYRYLGKNFRERERIKRKRSRWRVRLALMPLLERRAMLSELIELEHASSGAASAAGVDPLAVPDDAVLTASTDDARSRIAIGNGARA